MKLVQQAKKCVWEYIDNMRAVKYLEQQEKCVLVSNGNIPKQCRIGKTCFTSVAVIGGKLFRKQPK